MKEADEAQLKRALDAYDQGDMQTAKPLLTDLTKRYPGSFEANEALGTLYVEAGELPASLVYLRRACVLAPDQAIAHANLGAAYLKSGQGAEAVDQLRTATQADPRNGNTQSNLGQALMLTRKYADAAKALRSAVELMPDDSGLKYNLALALFDNNQPADAARVLDQLPESAASDQTELLGGDIDERLSNYPKAIAHYQAAARLNPSDANLYALALELLRHWTWDEALKISEYASTRYPASPHFQLSAGIAEYGAGQYAASASIFSTLLAQDSENALYADLLGRSCGFLTEEMSTACDGLEAFAQKHPNNAQAATYAAASMLHRPAAQQDQKAIAQLLTQAIATNPRLADAYFQMGVLDQTQQAWKESAAVLEKSIELRPTYPDAHYRLSRAYAHLGRKEEAQQQMDLHQKYSQEDKDRLNAHLQEVVIFLIKSN